MFTPPQEIIFAGATVLGISIETTIEKAAVDCPAIWEKFIPLFEKEALLPLGEYDVMYGVSAMTDPATFTYWAGIDKRRITTIPPSMKTTTLAAGLYLVMTIASVEKASEAHQYLYMQWLPNQTTYTLDQQRFCFERYDEQYMQNGSFTLYMPAVKNA